MPNYTEMQRIARVSSEKECEVEPSVLPPSTKYVPQPSPLQHQSLSCQPSWAISLTGITSGTWLEVEKAHKDQGLDDGPAGQ